ncbi:hypothetical protein TKK_0003535 [Trichogramma kaykai]
MSSRRASTARSSRTCAGSCNPRTSIAARLMQQQQQQQQQQRSQNNTPGPGTPKSSSLVDGDRRVEQQIYEFSIHPKRLSSEGASPVQSRPCSPGLCQEDQRFIEGLQRRMQLKKRQRGCCVGGVYIRKVIALLAFFFLQGLLSTLMHNSKKYQTFFATQLCGFIVIMFWDSAGNGFF